MKWRDGKYRLKWGGFAEEIVEKKSDLKPLIKTNSNLIDTKSIQLSNLNSSSLSANSKSKAFNHKRNNSYSVLMNSNNIQTTISSSNNIGNSIENLNNLVDTTNTKSSLFNEQQHSPKNQSLGL